jgi:hypothetical protein
MFRRSTARLQCTATASTGLVASLLHPALVERLEFRSPEWQRCMLHLYRQVLKSHQIFLENDMQRDLGDRFVKAEFRRHKGTNVKYACIFYKGWADYVAQLEGGKIGRDLTDKEQKLLNDEQRNRLGDLRKHVVDLKTSQGGLQL